MAVAEEDPMTIRPEPNAIARWRDAASQTTALLLENEQLLGQRLELFKKRSALLRDLVRTASTFVDRAAVHRHDDSEDKDPTS
jgi:hypothetical protein